jgi:hypothetical protein
MAQRKRKNRTLVHPENDQTVTPQNALQSVEEEGATPTLEEPESPTEAFTAPLSDIVEPQLEDDEDTVDNLQILPTGRVMNSSEYQELKNTGLPPHLTLWEIEDSPYTEDRKILVFYNGEKPVTHMEISPDTTEELLTALNHEIAYTAEDSADSWFIKTPDAGNEPPYLHLTSNGAIVDSLQLTKPFMKEIMPQLLKVYNPVVEAKKKGVVPWASTHRIKSGIVIAILTSMFLYGTYTYFF